MSKTSTNSALNPKVPGDLMQDAWTELCEKNPLRSPPGQQNQSARLAASAEVDQVGGTITCSACGSTNTESCCHPAEFCQAICNDCNTSLNADGSIWVEKQEPTLEQFQRWLENRAHEAHAHYWNGPEGETLAQEINRCKPFTLQISECRVATSLLMQFKQEQRA